MSSSDSSKPPAAGPEPGLISSIASSATGLLNTLANPSPSATTSALSSSAASSSKPPQQHALQSASSSSAEAHASSSASHHPTASYTSAEFRSNSADPNLVSRSEDDFTSFASAQEPDIFTRHATSYTYTPDATDGAEVAALLGFALASSEVYVDDLSEPVHPDMSHAAVVAFAVCDDPVEFLLASPEWGLYTDSVWGGLLEVLEDAKKEVEKGKGTDEGRAVERLKMVWGQLRAKL